MASVRTQVVDLLVTELKKIDGGTATSNPGNFIEPYTFKSNVFDTNVFRNWKYLEDINSPSQNVGAWVGVTVWVLFNTYMVFVGHKYKD